MNNEKNDYKVGEKVKITYVPRTEKYAHQLQDQVAVIKKIDIVPFMHDKDEFFQGLHLDFENSDIPLNERGELWKFPAPWVELVS